MFLAAKEFPLPVEYRFLPLEEVFHEPPADVVDRTLVFLDCGNIDRMPVEFLRRDGARLLNIDHHHDNTRFGTVNLVDTEASCTAEIVLELAKRLGAEITPEIASALYVGLVTDTGMFMYENTARRLAPDGRRADRGRGGRQRHLPPPLRAGADREAAPDRAGAGEGRALRRRPARGHLHRRRRLRGDRRRRGAHRGHHRLRARRSRAPRWRPSIRDKTDGGRSARKVSLRSTDGAVDVSAIAREHGRRRAPARRRLRQRPDATPSWSSSCVPRSAAQTRLSSPAAPSCSSTSRPASPPTTSSPALGARFGAKTGHAGTLDPFATGLLIVLLGRAATREQRRFMELPKTYRVRARFGAVSTTGDPDGEITETGVRPGGRARAAHRRDAPAPAGLLGGQGRRRARLPAGAPRRGGSRCPSGSSTVHRFEQLSRAGDEAEFEIECSSGTYVRSLIADLGDAYCTRAAADRRSARSRSRRPTRPAPIPLADALARLERSLSLAADEHRGHPLAGRRAPPAHVAIGTFDGVHVGHRRVIDGADTVLTFEPHPLERHPPRGGAEADHAVRHQARRDRGPRRRGAGRDPLRPATSRRSTPRSSASGILVDRLGAEQGLASARTSASASGRRATPRCSTAAPEFETRGRAAGGGRRRDRLLDPDPGPDRRRRRRGRDALPGRAVPARGDGGRGRQARPHARLPDRERGPRRRLRLSRARRLRRVRRRRARRRSTWACGRRSRPGAAC